MAIPAIVPAVHVAGGEGPPILLLHGFASDRLSWLGNLAELTKHGRVHTLDLPGHGATPLGAEASIAALADSVLAAIETIGPEPVRLVGHSLGGVVGITLTARAPERVRSLAVIAPAGLGGPIDHDFLASLPRAGDAATVEDLLKRLVTRPRLIGRQLVAHVLAQLQNPDYRTALTRLAAELETVDDRMFDAIAAVAAASLPRLVVWGEMDRMIPPDPDRIAAFATEIAMIPGAGHLPHVEEVRQVNATLGAFLAAHR